MRPEAIALSVIAFLLSAKAHGRQLRLERERAGITSVVFGGQNPPFVQALWRRERWLFWGATLLFAGLAAVTQRWFAIAFAPSLAFLVTGVLSLIRARGPELAGSAGWLGAATATLAAAMLIGFYR